MMSRVLPPQSLLTGALLEAGCSIIVSLILLSPFKYRPVLTAAAVGGSRRSLHVSPSGYTQRAPHIP